MKQIHKIILYFLGYITRNIDVRKKLVYKQMFGYKKEFYGHWHGY